MNKLITTIIFLLLSITAFSQTEAEEEIFTIAEQMPEYKGGLGEMIKFINSNIQYPKMDAKGLEGTVYVSYIVEKNGKTTGHKIQNSRGWTLETEALRVTQLLEFEKPGMQGDKPVRVQLTQPIKFKLN